MLFYRRIRDKYETELREVEKSERETTERYNTIKAKYNELEGEHERLKVILRQKEKELEDIHRVYHLIRKMKAHFYFVILNRLLKLCNRSVAAYLMLLDKNFQIGLFSLKRRASASKTKWQS